MKKLFLTGATLLLTLFCYSQDLIIKRNADEIQAKVLEVTSSEIRYKKSSNPDGPTYSILRSEVFMIKYENGEKDVITPLQTGQPSSEQSVQQSAQEPDEQQPAQQLDTSGFVSKGKYKVNYLSPGGRTLSDVVGITDYERTMGVHFSIFGEINYPVLTGGGLSGDSDLGFGIGALWNTPLDRNLTGQMGLVYTHRSFVNADDGEIKARFNYLTIPIVFRAYLVKKLYISAGGEVDVLINGTISGYGEVLKGRDFWGDGGPLGINFVFDIGYGPIGVRLRGGLINTFANTNSKLFSAGLFVLF